MKKTPKRRKISTERKLKRMGVAYNKYLPMVESSAEVTLKSLDDICRRAIASLIMTQVAIDASNDDVEESLKVFSEMLERFGVADALNDTEKKLIDRTYSQQDIIDIVWEYEAYWALVWALGLIGDISDSSQICDCEKAIMLVNAHDSYESFKSACKLRDIEEILDMFDLYYRYHWAVVHNRIYPDTKIGNLNPDVVVERRRGLEWLISEEADWFEISLDT